MSYCCVNGVILQCEWCHNLLQCKLRKKINNNGCREVLDWFEWQCCLQKCVAYYYYYQVSCLLCTSFTSLHTLHAFSFCFHGDRGKMKGLCSIFSWLFFLEVGWGGEGREHSCCNQEEFQSSWVRILLHFDGLSGSSWTSHFEFVQRWPCIIDRTSKASSY